jgi:hypothetical protein
MAKPTVKVEVAWTDGPYVAAPTWSDITAYVRSVSTSRGRTDDWQNFDSGSATLVLDNRDRRFDPTYTAGPNYGNLQPRRQIRVTADAGTGSGYVDLFRGYVDGWPVRLSQAGFDSTVTITAYETLGLIAQEQLPTDWADDYILSLSPTHYWRLDETIDPAGLPTTAAALASYRFADSGSGNAPLIPLLESRPISNIEPLGIAITRKAISFANGASPWADGRVYSGLTGNPTFTFASWHTFQDSTGLNLPNLFEGNFLISGQYTTFSVSYDITNQRFSVALFPYAASSTGRYYYYSTGLNTSVPHHVAITVALTGTNTANVDLLVDGVVISQTSTTTFTKIPVTGLTYATLTLGEGSNQQAILHEGSNWTTSQLRTIYQLGNNVLTESTKDRFLRVVQQTPISASMHNVTLTPAGTVGRLTVGGAFVNNELQLTNDSEGGELYTTKAGVITMTNRTWYQSGTSATSQATFGSGGIPIQTEIEYAWNADNIRNTLDISWSGDAVVTCSDSTSRSTYGVMQDSWTTALSTYTDAQTLGNLLVGFGKLPRLVISAVEVGQALSAANWNTVLGLELLDRITVVIPEPVGSNLSQTQIIQQIEHDITPGDWRTRILGSARWSSVFTIGTSYLDGTDILG